MEITGRPGHPGEGEGKGHSGMCLFPGWKPGRSKEEAASLHPSMGEEQMTISGFYLAALWGRGKGRDCLQEEV